MKKIIFLLFPVFLFSATCKRSEILGVFPQINGFSCSDYALFVGFVSIISAYIFWDQVTK
jgi:hypothetical protein